MLFFYKHTYKRTIDRKLFSGLSKVIPLSFLLCVVFPVSAQVIRDSFPAMEIVFNLKDTLRLPDTLPLMEEKRAIPGFEKKQTLFYIALKTNTLYDTLLVPNIGMEFYVWRSWSLAGNWMYAWWKSDHRYNSGVRTEVMRKSPWHGWSGEEITMRGKEVGGETDLV